MQVLIRWGDPVVAGAPAFDVANQTAAAQEKQFGYNNDYLGLHPLPAGSKGSDRFLLVANHEYVNPNLMFAGLGAGRDANLKASKEQMEVQMAAVGGAVVEIAREGGNWKVVEGSKYARRLSANTAMEISGPAAGHDKLKTNADPTGRSVFGTFANCAGGSTPWGTWLTCEENFQSYFGGDPAKLPDADARQALRARRCRLCLEPPCRALRSRQGAERAQPLRLGGRDRSLRAAVDAGEAHGARPLAPRGLHLRARQGRPRRLLYRRRRALRVRLQVRHRTAVEPGRSRRQQEPAGRRHALRRSLRRGRQGRLAAAGPWPGAAHRGERLRQPGRRGDQRAPRRRSPEGDADGPAGGYRDQSGRMAASMSC